MECTKIRYVVSIFRHNLGIQTVWLLLWTFLYDKEPPRPFLLGPATPRQCLGWMASVAPAIFGAKWHTTPSHRWKKPFWPRWSYQLHTYAHMFAWGPGFVVDTLCFLSEKNGSGYKACLKKQGPTHCTLTCCCSPRFSPCWCFEVSVLVGVTVNFDFWIWSARQQSTTGSKHPSFEWTNTTCPKDLGDWWFAAIRKNKSNCFHHPPPKKRFEHKHVSKPPITSLLESRSLGSTRVMTLLPQRSAQRLIFEPSVTAMLQPTAMSDQEAKCMFRTQRPKNQGNKLVTWDMFFLYNLRPRG